MRIGLIFRNYSSKTDEKLIIKIRDYCRINKRKFFLSNDLRLAIKLGLDGVYLPSFNKDFFGRKFQLKQKFMIMGSAHNLKEIKMKELQGVNQIFLSSLFKKKNSYLGLNKFRLLSKHTSLIKIALGGINKTNLKKLNLINIDGFAGISYFEE